MAGYVIANVVWRDLQRLAEYSRLMPPSLEKYGGRVLVPGEAPEVKEGQLTLSRLVVIEFPSVEQARVWYDSAEYRPALQIRQKSANNDLMIVEGTSL
jgi:uncharacterized protein (DUF1330 family)